jgi:hypothetical protein
METSEGWPHIAALYGGRTMFRNNLFYDNDFAIGTEHGGFADARFNWWGDSTGPRAETNPGGLGDSISSNVLYDPWHADTNFFSATPERSNPLPQSATLDVYPNPFNIEATLKLTVAKAMIVRIEIFDILGRSIQDIFSGPVAGDKEIRFNASRLSTGLYFARAYDTIHNRPVAITKMLLLK